MLRGAVRVEDGVGERDEGHVGWHDADEVGAQAAGAVLVEGGAGIGVEGVERAEVGARGVALLEGSGLGEGGEAESSAEDGGIKHVCLKGNVMFK